MTGLLTPEVPLVRSAARQRTEPPAAYAAWLADMAVQSLIDEVELTPKPALVDRRGSGAHVDLDLAVMHRSAHALRPGFAEMAVAARGRRPGRALREHLARIGREAEWVMLAATDGSNAHRGAIWIVGLLLSGAAIRGPVAATELAKTAAAIARHPDRYAPPVSSHGERMRALYGAQGARGEAMSGFPHVVEVGLPALHAARARGETEGDAQLNALIAIIAELEDTCLLHRGGHEALATAQRGARQVLAHGGVGHRDGRAALLRLDADLLARNASPGGAADLLAATLFVDRIQWHPQAHEREQQDMQQGDGPRVMRPVEE